MRFELSSTYKVFDTLIVTDPNEKTFFGDSSSKVLVVRGLWIICTVFCSLQEVGATPHADRGVLRQLLLLLFDARFLWLFFDRRRVGRVVKLEVEAGGVSGWTEVTQLDRGIAVSVGLSLYLSS